MHFASTLVNEMETIGRKVLREHGASDNVMYALMYGSAIMGVDFKAVGPEETVCDPKVLEVSQELAKKSGATITISHDPEDVKGSDVIYTDIWVSMGESEELYPCLLYTSDAADE